MVTHYRHECNYERPRKMDDEPVEVKRVFAWMCPRCHRVYVMNPHAPLVRMCGGCGLHVKIVEGDQ